jgi:hypothetical protein
MWQKTPAGNYRLEDGRIVVIIHCGSNYRVSFDDLHDPSAYLDIPDDIKTTYRNIRTLDEALAMGDKMVKEIKDAWNKG